MSQAARRAEASDLSLREFRAFQQGQPDGQRWELVGGTPVMMAPPKVVHQKIAFNLVRLLNEALRGYDPSLVAVFAPGVDLGLGAQDLTGVGRAASYAPEPDVAVIQDVQDPDQRIVGAAVVLAEVASSTDDVLSVDGRPWLEIKASLYRLHGPCRTVLIVEQERVAITCWERTGEVWTSRRLADLDEVLEVACCGLRCHVRDLYVSTHLAAGPARRSEV